MYLRKSREDIDHEKNTGENVLQGHRERLTDRLNTLGLPWIERAEIGSGDTIQARKVFQQVLNQDVPSGKYQAIAVTEMSRLGRGDMEDAGRIYKTIINYNLFIITPHKIYDPRNPSDLRQIRFELFLSREEFESIRERLQSGRDRKAKKGYAPNYLAILGLSHVRGKFTVIPEELEIVKEIFELRAEEFSYERISVLMNQKGHITKNGHEWTSSSIRRVLNNVHYIGKARWKDAIVDAQHPPLIPIELWNKVHCVNQSKSKVKLPIRDNEYLVELFCHECGNRMYGEICKTKNKDRSKTYNVYPIYVCYGKRTEAKCSFTVRAQKVHEEILLKLKTIISDKWTRDKLIALRDKHFSVDQESTQEKIIKLQKEIKTKQNFLRKVEVDYEKGELNPTLYSKHFDKVTNDIEVLENTLAVLKSKPAENKLENPEELFSKLSLALDKWDSLENKKKKAVIKAFLPRVEIDKQFNFYFATNLPASL